MCNYTLCASLMFALMTHWLSKPHYGEVFNINEMVRGGWLAWVYLQSRACDRASAARYMAASSCSNGTATAILAGERVQNGVYDKWVGVMCCVGTKSAAVATGFVGCFHPWREKLKMDNLRHILAHSQPIISNVLFFYERGKIVHQNPLASSCKWCVLGI